MNESLRQELISLAEDESIAAYSDIAPLIGLSVSNDKDREIFADMLTEIAKVEESKNRPMLTALIVQKTTPGIPSEGFFHLAKGFGYFDGSIDESDCRRFWEKQKESVYDFWRNA